MALKAAEHYLWEPLELIPELRVAGEEWRKLHDMPDGFQLFHYTTVEGMHGILKDRSLWLSHAACFNDPNEVDYGRHLVLEILNSFITLEEKTPIGEFLGGMIEYVQLLGKPFHHQAFVVCFCKKGNQLSQWREYANKGRGYSCGFEFSEATRISSSPEALTAGKQPIIRKVIYDGAEQIRLVTNYLEKSRSAVTELHRAGADLGRMSLQSVNVLLEMILCFKHPAFEEEREWRLFRAVMDSSKSEELRFRDSAGLLVPYRPTYLFDFGGSEPTFPLRTIYLGPAVDPTRAKIAVDLLLRHVATHSSPIKLVNPKIMEPEFELR